MKWKHAVDSCLLRYAEYVPPGKAAPPQSGYARGFVTKNGRQLAIETQRSSETVNVWIENIALPVTGCRMLFYPSTKTRSSALTSVAPSLSGPNYRKPAFAAYKVYVTSEAELADLLDWYEAATEAHIARVPA